MPEKKKVKEERINDLRTPRSNKFGHLINNAVITTLNWKCQINGKSRVRKQV